MKATSKLFIVITAFALTVAPVVSGSFSNAYANTSAKATTPTNTTGAYDEADFETPPPPPGTPAAAGVAPQDPSSRRCPQCGFCFAQQDPPYRGGRHQMMAPNWLRGGPRMGRCGHPGQRMGRGFGGSPAEKGRGVAAARILRHAGELDLSEQQISQLEEIALDVRKQLVDLHAFIEKERLDLEELMRSDSDDITAIKKRLNTLAQKRVDVQELKLRNWIEVKKILTEDQKKLIAEKHPRLGGFLD